MADKTFRLEIIAPDRIFYSNDIYMVEYNTVEGQVGVYADHIPMTQIIAPGRLIITERNEEKQAALLSGFVEITPEKIRMILDDVGPGIPDVDLAMQAGYSTAPDEVRSLGFGAGMGLPNMKKYTDTMEIDTRIGEGTKITMVVMI